MRVILGSKSAARLSILRSNGFDVISIPPKGVSEKPIKEDEAAFATMTLAQQVEYIARLKTDAVLAHLSNSPPSSDEKADFLICGDILVQDAAGNALGKPHSSEQAEEWLDRYSRDKQLATVQALDVVNLTNGKRVSGSDVVNIYLASELPSGPDRTRYLKEAMGAAGALIVEDEYVADRLDRLEGDQDSVMGLSMRLLRDLLNQLTKN